jgi:hemolysin III
MGKRTRLADRKLPDYTRGEEITNAVTHIAGGAFGIAALVLCVVFAAIRGDAFRVVGAAVYGVSLTALYTISSVYHALRPGTGKKVLQVLDHCTIYFLIGGTYTPVVFGPVHDRFPAVSWVIFGLVWGLCCFATVFTAIDHNEYAVLSMTC